MNIYRVQYPVGWQGKTIPAGATITAHAEQVTHLLQHGAIVLDAVESQRLEHLAAAAKNETVMPHALLPVDSKQVSDAETSATETEQPSKVNDDQVDAKTTVNLHTLKLDELKQTATELDLDTTGAKTKADYVALLVPHVIVSDSEVVE